jgi:hypothetical protein
MSEVIVLEFNELNQEVLLDMVQRGELPHFKRLIEQGHMATTSVQEDYEKLEPWIQWVTAHTGKVQTQHKAFNLSDVQHTQLQQIWDVLEQQGIACGLMSPMNARRGALSKGFFVPDPWTVSDDTYPAALTPIYKFLAQKVQQHNVSLDKDGQGGSKLGFLRACLKAGLPLSALGRLGAAYLRVKLDKKTKWRLAAALDRFLWDMTATLRRKHGTRYTAVFLNSVAHYQHHYWTQHQASRWQPKFPVLFAKRNPVAQQNLHAHDDPIAHGMRSYDTILGEAIDCAGIHSVLVMTGLSQVPFEGYDGGSGFYLYRPLDHAKLFAALGLKTQSIAPLMSRDAMLYFDNELSRSHALSILVSAQVNGQALFQFSEETELRLFVKVIYSFDVTPDATVVATGLAAGAMKFGEYFLLITFKTGHHSPEGTVIAPKAAFAHLPAAQETQPLPLTQMPELVFRMLALQDASRMAQSLALAPA